MAVTESLDAEAAVFARLLETAGHDTDAAFSKARALADGLFPHQVEGVAFLLGRRRAILADEMGLGKTRQAIVSLRHLAPAGPYLVVCPASVKRNWAREIALAAPDTSILVIEGSAPIAPTADWVVVNYDVLARHRDSLGQVAWAALVFDEAHYLKNHTSVRSRLAREFAARASANTAHPPAVQLLTGTPLTSRPRDLFVLLQLVQHPLGRSFLAFAKRYCAAEKGEFGWKTGGASNIEELTVQLHGIMLRRSKDDVLALPPKLRTWLPVAVPTTTGARAIKKVLELLTGKGVEREPVTAPVREGDRSRPVSPAGPVPAAPDWAPMPARGQASVPDRDRELRKRGKLLAFITEARQALAVAKTSSTLDFVKGAIDQGEKVVVFSCFEDPIQGLASALGPSAVVLTGKTPTDRRQDIVDRFQQDDDVRVFLANIVAGGTGVNLTAATQVVFNDLDWVPANHWQAEDRAYRIGQKRTVNVTYFVAQNTIDDFVRAVLETKAAIVRAIVEGDAISEGLGGDVLDELQRALHSVSSGLTAAPGGLADDDLVERLVKEASEEFRARHETHGAGTAGPRSASDAQAFERALERLARVLAGSPSRRFRIASTSHNGVEHEIVVADADVTCTCRGFEYRGQCRHARDVKAALASGQDVPAPYAEVR